MSNIADIALYSDSKHQKNMLMLTNCLELEARKLMQRHVSGKMLTMHPLLLFLDFLASNQQASTELMLFANLAQLVKDLQSQLPGGGDDQSTQAIQRTPFQPV